MGFKEDIDKGLSAPVKNLPSKYFYDAQGDKLFTAIMHSPDYYLTNSEHEIFSTQKEKILEKICEVTSSFDLIEFGAGDGLKTKILLRHFLQEGIDLRYVPIDISSHVLKELKKDLEEELPDLRVECLNDEYFSALKRLSGESTRPKVLLFLGSNIGNFSPDRALEFLKELNEIMATGDQLIIGIDLKKDPNKILKAYNDQEGITRAFNLNLLKRINTELQADFNLDQFDHYPMYDPVAGEARSYIVSKKEQDVFVGALNKTFHFEQWELIHTEISRKFNVQEVENLAAKTGFKVRNHFFDCHHYYVDSLWVK